MAHVACRDSERPKPAKRKGETCRAAPVRLLEMLTPVPQLATVCDIGHLWEAGVERSGRDSKWLRKKSVARQGEFGIMCTTNSFVVETRGSAGRVSELNRHENRLKI